MISKALNHMALVLILIIVLLFPLSTVDGQSPHGWIYGRVQEKDSSLEAVDVSLAVANGPRISGSSTDSSGRYFLLGLLPGDYELTFSRPGYKTVIEHAPVESGRGSLVDVDMEAAGPGEARYGADWQRIPTNPWGTAYGTVFDRSRLENLPSAPSIWALLENQVPSAIVDRIDEGGLATGSIPLVGVRGSSWTQNEFRLNGINVTDPYDTGKQLFYPDFGSLQEFQVSTAFHASEVSAPGGSFDLTTRRGGPAYRAEGEAYYLGEPFQSGNLDSRLRGFGFSSTPRFKRFGEGQFTIGGPAPHLEKWAFFTTVGVQHLSKGLPGFNGTPTATVMSGLLRMDGNLGARDGVEALASGQIVDN